MSEPLPAKALVRPDLERDGVSIAVRRSNGGIIDFTTTTEYLDESKPETKSTAKPLHLREDEARAVYEALGRYFGGDAVSNQRLRQDYDHERGRVDKLIGHLIGVRHV